MATREGPNPAFADVRRRVSRRIAGVCFPLTATSIISLRFAFLEFATDLPSFAGGLLVRAGMTDTP
jgi:hypothetical protein